MRRGTSILVTAALTLAGAVTLSAADPPQPVRPPAGAMGVNDTMVAGDAMPRTLAEFRFFRDAKTAIPMPGMVPYRLNTPLYSDGAEKLRYAYIPAGKQVLTDGPGLLRFPVGSALIKTFAFGEGAQRRLIETRVMLHRADGWVALPYLWNAEQTEARLALAGARVDVTTPTGQAISYRVPNKNQCKECHGLDGAVVPIGPKARNVSRKWLAEMVTVGQLDIVPIGADVFPIWKDRAEKPAEIVARAYLDVNCAHCHRPGATASNSGLDLRYEQDDRQLLGVLKRPVAAGRGAGGHLFDIVPGKADQSILIHRMASDEPGVAMPELGKSTVDAEGLAAVRRWIDEMPAQ